MVHLVSPVCGGGGGSVGLAAGQLQHHLIGQPLTHYHVQQVDSKISNAFVKLEQEQICFDFTPTGFTYPPYLTASVLYYCWA